MERSRSIGLTPRSCSLRCKCVAAASLSGWARQRPPTRGRDSGCVTFRACRRCPSENGVALNVYPTLGCVVPIGSGISRILRSAIDRVFQLNLSPGF